MLATPRFPNLDKLRGLAALSVLVYHVIEHTHWSAYPVEGALYWGRIGWMGVDLFFVISGLVISYSAWVLFHRLGNRWQKIYWERRIVRIFPLYLLTLLVYMTMVKPEWLSAKLGKLAVQVGTHLLFVHNFFPSTHGSINGVNWSVGVEMQFYLLVALLLPWLVRARLPSLVLICLSVAWLWRYAVFYFLQDRGTSLLFQYSTQLPGSIDEFALGVVVCKLLVDPHYARLADWMTRNRRYVFCLSAACCSMMLKIYFDNAVYWNSAWMVVAFRSLIGLSACSLILCAIYWPWKGPAALSSVLDYAGKISYGIYLWHLPVILMLLAFGGAPGFTFLLETFFATVLLASLSYHLWEGPWVRYFRHKEQIEVCAMTPYFHAK